MKNKDVKFFTEDEAKKAGIDNASLKIKELAANQKISVNISADQLEALQRQWDSWDNSKPAEITFLVDGKTEAKLKVAAYAYRGDTCCA